MRSGANFFPGVGIRCLSTSLSELVYLIFEVQLGILKGFDLSGQGVDLDLQGLIFILKHSVVV